MNVGAQGYTNKHKMLFLEQPEIAISQTNKHQDTTILFNDLLALEILSYMDYCIFHLDPYINNTYVIFNMCYIFREQRLEEQHCQQ